MNLWKPALELNRKVLYHDLEDKTWKTLHPRWDMELFDFLYSESDEAILDEREGLLKSAISRILDLEDGKTTAQVVSTVYAMTNLIPIYTVENVVPSELPDYMDNKTKCYIYVSSMASVYNRLGRFRKAKEKCDKAIQLNANFYDAWTEKAKAHVGLKEYNEAIKCCDEAIKISHSHGQARHIRGMALGRLGMYDETLKSYDKALKIDPDDSLTLYNRGIILSYLGRDDEAIESYDKALKIDPADVQTWHNRGNLLGILGRYVEDVESYIRAIKSYEKALRTGMSDAPALGVLEMYDGAIQIADRALQLDPKNAAAWYGKGWILDKFGKKDEAKEYLERARRLGYEP